MENKLESLGSKVSETKSVIQEFGEKISQALEMEKKKLREQAEEEARQIVTRAKEEASKFIIQARQESEIEASKFLDKIKEKAEQILRESREKAAAEARRESAKIIHETKEKATQVISEVVRSSITQTKSELSQISSEVKNKLENETSQLFTVTKNIEQIIDETQSNIKAGIDRLVKSITETGNRIQSINDTFDGESAVDEPPEIEQAEEPEQVDVHENHEPVMNLPQAIVENEAGPAGTPEEPETTMNPPEAFAEIVTKTDQRPESSTTEQISPEKESAGGGEAEQTVSRVEIDKQLQEGIDLLDAGKKEEALEVLAKVIETDPENALAWRKLGTALGMLGRYMEALKALRRATDLAPKDITAWHNTKIILDKLGQKKEAREAKETEKQLIREYPDQYKEVFKKSK
jgi:tetratricopeptide (TPR) repeat protein